MEPAVQLNRALRSLADAVRNRSVVLAGDEQTRRACGQELSDLTGVPILALPSRADVAPRPIVYVGHDWPDGAALSALAWFHTTTAGVDNLIDAWPHDALLTRTVGRMGRRSAEYVLCHILAASQQLDRAAEQQRHHRWQRYIPRLLEGTSAVIFGTGMIGVAVAELLCTTGVRTYGVATTPRRLAPFARVEAVLADLSLERVDWAISTLPLTTATRGYFTAGLLEALGGAYFINVGRGAVVEMAALADALANGDLTGATLDVLPQEPLPPASSIWEIERARITPHIAGLTTASDIVSDFAAVWGALRDGSVSIPLVVSRERGY